MNFAWHPIAKSRFFLSSLFEIMIPVEISFFSYYI
jgi:hypothetical protein